MKKQKSSKLNKRSKSRFSRFATNNRAKLLTFMIVFGLIGGFIVFRTYAATPSNANCTKSYCYYPVEPKVAYFQNGLRQTHGANPAYVGLNECASGYARQWAAYMATNNYFGHSNTRWNWQAGMDKCGNWHWLGENIWKGPCGDTNVDQTAADCAWKAVDGPTSSYLNDGEPSNPHLANVLHSPMSVYGVGSYYDKNGVMWIVSEYVLF